MNCKGIDKKECIKSNCIWVDGNKRKYCKTYPQKNKTKNKEKSPHQRICPNTKPSPPCEIGLEERKKEYSDKSFSICCYRKSKKKNIDKGKDKDKDKDKDKKNKKSKKQIVIKGKEKQDKDKEDKDKNETKKITNMNQFIIEKLTVLKNNEIINKQLYKVKAYNIAINAIKNDFGEKIPITNGSQLQAYKGVGEKIANKVNEILETGKLKQAQVVEEQHSENVIIMKLTEIHGIGAIKAKELVINKKINSIDDLIKRKDELQSNGKPLLNAVQQMGLSHYKDSLFKIPREEMDKHNDFLQKMCKNINKEYPGTTATIVGSYRRNSTSSGDIDILITNKNSYSDDVYKKFISNLTKEKYIVDILSKGNKKLMGYAKINDKSKARRIDILYTNKNEYPFALLYFTGSKSFNTALRDYANTLNLRLNEYNLKVYDKSTKGIGQIVDHIFETENDIFAYLKIPFIKPENRTDKELFKVLKYK